MSSEIGYYFACAYKAKILFRLVNIRIYVIKINFCPFEMS